MGWPTAIICGFMKSGTTPLIHNLNRHPEIKMIKNPDDPKKASTEIRFFNDGQPWHTFTNKGIDWYQSLFDDSRCQCTKCANYLEQRLTMERIYKYIPNVKLIICMRNPVDRAYSEVKMTHPNVKFNFKFAKKFGYLKRGEYYNLIKENVLPFFEKDQIHIIIQERMKNDTINTMKNLYDFLGVSNVDFDIQKVTPEEATNRNLNLQEDGNIKSYKVWNSNYKPMNQGLREELYKYFKVHNKRLFKFLGYKINEWK